MVFCCRDLAARNVLVGAEGRVKVTTFPLLIVIVVVLDFVVIAVTVVDLIAVALIVVDVILFTVFIIMIKQVADFGLARDLTECEYYRKTGDGKVALIMMIMMIMIMMMEMMAMMAIMTTMTLKMATIMTMMMGKLMNHFFLQLPVKWMSPESLFQRTANSMSGEQSLHMSHVTCAIGTCHMILSHICQLHVW